MQTETSQSKCISDEYHKNIEEEKKELTLVTSEHSILTIDLKIKSYIEL